MKEEAKSVIVSFNGTRLGHEAIDTYDSAFTKLVITMLEHHSEGRFMLAGGDGDGVAELYLVDKEHPDGIALIAIDADAFFGREGTHAAVWINKCARESYIECACSREGAGYLIDKWYRYDIGDKPQGISGAEEKGIRPAGFDIAYAVFSRQELLELPSEERR